MSLEAFQGLEEAFARLVAVPREDRDAILQALPPEVRAEVERLLACDDLQDGDQAGDPLGLLIGREAAAWVEGEGADPWIGRQLGPWRIEGRLGAGGMSTVYLARRADGELPLPVALKVIRPGLASPEMLARFREERRILAGLIHPSIARFLDGGSAPDGSPYFVLERVEGEPIDRYADRNRLTLAARVDLVRRVAEAVAEAHRRLIVHRDLKPSNILVTAGGVPKLLDFGIAKLLDPEGREDQTAPHVRLFTPAYASPEQVAGEAVTTATDVYSLGVVLRELLAGRRPGAGEPDRQETARLRGLRPRALARALAGDLDTILATCLRAEPERRYAGADRLAEDLARYLAGRPISARRDTVPYRLGKWVRRHRWAAAFSLLAVLALAGFVAALAVQSRRLARERDLSLAERRRAEAVSAFLLDRFRFAQPGGQSGEGMTARQLADQGAEEVRRQPAADPRVQATLLETVGRIYVRLGLYDLARKPLEQSLALRRRTLPPDDPDVAESLNRLAILSAETGAYEEAILGFREVLALRRRRFPPGSQRIADSLNNLALALHDRGSYAEAAAYYREGLEIDVALSPPADPGVLTSRANWALLCYDLGDQVRAERELREILALSRQAPGDPEVAELHRYLGLVLTARGRLAEAEPLLLSAERQLTGTLGPEHPETARALASLAELRLAQRKVEEAVLLYRRSFEARERHLGPEHAETALSLAGWARALAAQGNVAVAEAKAREALRRGRRSLPSRHPDMANLLVGLAEVLAREGRCAELPALAAEIRAVRASALHPGDGRIGEGERLAAGCNARP